MNKLCLKCGKESRKSRIPSLAYPNDPSCDEDYYVCDECEVSWSEE